VLEVADVCGQQWETDGKTDPGDEDVAFTDGYLLEPLLELGGASCSHLGQRVDADTTNSPTGDVAINVGLEATPELEDRDCRGGEAAGAQARQPARNRAATRRWAPSLEEIYEGHGGSRAAWTRRRSPLALKVPATLTAPGMSSAEGGAG